VDLAPRCDVTDVSRRLDGGNTKELAAFLRLRHESRFFEPIECLRQASNSYHGYGFSMMALCCPLIETIECYRQGLPTTSKKEWRAFIDIQNKQSVSAQYPLATAAPTSGESAFVHFFTDFQAIFPDVDGSEFYHNIRNGLLHQAQTQNGWTIDAMGSVVCDRSQKHLNRNLFADALKAAFEHYVRELETLIWRNQSHAV
jgi:hypothetical protein